MNRATMRGCGALMAVVLSAGAAAAQPRGAGGAGGGGGGPPPAKVRLDAVRAEVVEQKRSVTGEVRPVRRSRLAAEEAGLVRELLVEPGDTVTAGQVIARLDSELLSLVIAQRMADAEASRALVKEREAQVAKSQRDLSRLQELMSSAGASQNEVDDAKTSVAEAEARLANAKAELAAQEALIRWNQQRLEKKTIRTPIAGRVIAKRVEVGEWVGEGEVVVEIVDLSEVDAYLDVPERFLAPLSTADATVRLRIAALGLETDARVSAVIAEGDRLARTFPIRVRLSNADGRLKPGMSAIGEVATGEAAEMLTVHKDAVLRDDSGAFVYFDAGGAAMRAPVEILFGAGERLAVRAPMLKAGVRTVIEGNERIMFPGQPLMNMDAPPGPPPGTTPPTVGASRPDAKPAS